MTPDEARGKACQIALEALDLYGRQARTVLGIEPDPRVWAEQKLIETWLRRRVCLGDKVLLRQLEKPLGRQVRPSRKQVLTEVLLALGQAAEGLAKERGNRGS
jgi:hypothetical protein